MVTPMRQGVYGVTMADRRTSRIKEDEELHERLRVAVLGRRIEIYTDQRMLDFQGSPIHNGWDHLLPLLVMMLLALAILLAAGVAVGIVAMAFGALGHLVGIKHFLAWRIRLRAKAYVMQGAAHLDQLWHLGGVALVVMNSSEPPCVAPRGDWRRFVRRNLQAEGFGTAATAKAPVDVPAAAQEIIEP